MINYDLRFILFHYRAANISCVWIASELYQRRDGLHNTFHLDPSLDMILALFVLSTVTGNPFLWASKTNSIIYNLSPTLNTQTLELVFFKIITLFVHQLPTDVWGALNQILYALSCPSIVLMVKCWYLSVV